MGDAAMALDMHRLDHQQPRPGIRQHAETVMCQSSATPSLALYWHIGETTMRFAKLGSASRTGENRALVMDRQDVRGMAMQFNPTR